MLFGKGCMFYLELEIDPCNSVSALLESILISFVTGTFIETCAYSFNLSVASYLFLLGLSSYLFAFSLLSTVDRLVFLILNLYYPSRDTGSEVLNFSSFSSSIFFSPDEISCYLKLGDLGKSTSILKVFSSYWLFKANWPVGIAASSSVFSCCHYCEEF